MDAQETPPPEEPVEFRSDPRILLDIAREELQTQLSFIDALDSKVATMFAVGSGLLGLLAAVFAVQPENVDREALVVVSVAGFYYAVLTVTSLIALWVKEFKIGPHLPSIWQDAQEKPEDRFVPELVRDYRKSLEVAVKAGKFKALAVRAALLCVLFQTVTLGLALAVVTA